MVEARKQRKHRTPVTGFRDPLDVKGKDPNYHYRIVNDVPGRIDRFIERDWEIVTDSDVSIGQKRVAVATAEGSPKKVPVGRGVDGYLMRIPKEYWEEDRAAFENNNKEVEHSIQKEAIENYGDVKGAKFKIER